jgi:type I restriction enzyme S subunit
MQDVDVPPKPEQRAIAHILGTLDDKIELNRRRNQTLEAMARALFNDWFVEFGPVRAKMEGREPYLPAELWQLFPDYLDDEANPQRWEIQPLSELLTIIGGGTPKTSVEEYWNGDIPWFSVVDTPSASDVFVVATAKTITAQGLAGSSARLIPKGTTIISARGTVGNLAIAGQEMTFNQSCYGLRGAGGAGDYFVYLTAQHMVDQLKSMAHGSVFSTITRQTFEAIRRPVPPPGILTTFERLVAEWFDAILSNVEESRVLAQLRDTLLPRLISGELRIDEAEKPMERD